MYHHRHYKTSDDRTLAEVAYQSDDMREDPLQMIFKNMSQVEKDQLFNNMQNDNDTSIYEEPI